MSTLLVDISAHGYGHAAMVLPVLAALHRRRPDVRLVLRTGLHPSWIAERLDAPFGHLADPVEIGMIMGDSVSVRAAETLAAYQRLHAEWDRVVERSADEIRGSGAGLVLSNISYVALAGAERAGVPGLAYSSLNWADVFSAYCGHLPGAAAVWERMARAYATATAFLQPEPSMPMPSIGNGIPVGPVARLGRAAPEQLRERLGLTADRLLVLTSMGGIPTPIDYAAWPRLGDFHGIVGSDERVAHPDLTPWRATGLSFIDLLASCDVLLVKPGYGLFSEGICNGRPILSIPREVWPETPAQAAWLEAYGRGRFISEADLRAGLVAAPAAEVLALPAKPRPSPTGIGQVVDQLLAWL